MKIITNLHIHAGVVLYFNGKVYVVNEIVKEKKIYNDIRVVEAILEGVEKYSGKAMVPDGFSHGVPVFIKGEKVDVEASSQGVVTKREKYDLDVLAFGAHPDDCEAMVGGTLIKLARKGYRVGIVDLTRGEMGTWGDEEVRKEESQRAASVMGIHHRECLNIPDTQVENSHQNRMKIVDVIRRLKPYLVFAPWKGQKHPDHNHALSLIYDGCFLAGLKKYGNGFPHRPKKILYYINHKMNVSPHIYIDISTEFPQKIEAMKCYKSQFAHKKDANFHSVFDRIECYNRFMGSKIGVKYAEAFINKDPLLIEDPLKVLTNTF